jgi:hypothetical protein
MGWVLDCIGWWRDIKEECGVDMSGEWTQKLMAAIANLVDVRVNIYSLRDPNADLKIQEIYAECSDKVEAALQCFLVDQTTNTFRFPIPTGRDKDSDKVAMYMEITRASRDTKFITASNMHLLSRKLDNILMMIDQK